MTQQTCKERVKPNYQKRMKDLRALMEADREGKAHPELGYLNEYGLAFDYVSPGTFRYQRRGYFRYQLSWGGPGDEFRYYVDERLQPQRIEYWFLDWFDGARRTIKSGPDFELLCELFEYFDAQGAMKAAEG